MDDARWLGQKRRILAVGAWCLQSKIVTILRITQKWASHDEINGKFILSAAKSLVLLIIIIVIYVAINQSSGVLHTVHWSWIFAGGSWGIFWELGRILRSLLFAQHEQQRFNNQQVMGNSGALCICFFWGSIFQYCERLITCPLIVHFDVK